MANILYEKMILEDYGRELTFADFMEICTKLDLPVLEVHTVMNPFDVPHVRSTEYVYPGIEEYRRLRMPEWSARNYDYENDRAMEYYSIPEIPEGEFDVFASNSSTSYKWHFVVLPFAVAVHCSIAIID